MQQKNGWVTVELKIFFNFATLNWIDLWCNGSTADFGSVSLGSSPGRSTISRERILGFSSQQSYSQLIQSGCQ